MCRLVCYLCFGYHLRLTLLYVGSLGQRSAKPFPDEAALQCRSGTMALKGNVPEQAMSNFRQALALNPYLWEAFEGLCAAGNSRINILPLF